MSHSLTTPSPATSLRAYLVRMWDEPESRSTLIGILGVLLFHLLLWLIAPHLFRFEAVMGLDRPHASPQTFSIEMQPDTFTKPAPPPPPTRFVETNPDAPDNVPDKTNNFAAQNQQAAQEKPTPDGKSDTPALEGKKADEPITQIVSGQLTKPIEHIEAQPPPVNVAETTVAPLKAEQSPLPGFEKKEGESKDSIGTNIAKIPDGPVRPVPEKIEGARDVPLIEGMTVIRPAIDPKNPRKDRPQVVKLQQTRPAILTENKIGTANIGLTGVDAKFSNYGLYLQRMVNTIQVQWERIIGESKTYPSPGTMVTVKFVLDSDGRIAKILDVISPPGTDQASRACVSGISDRAPYGPWTDDMKAVLGEKQELTFTFYYQ